MIACWYRWLDAVNAMNRIIITLSLLFLSFPVFCQEILSLDEVIQLAVENSLDIREKASGLARARAQYMQTKGGLDPELGVQGRYSITQNPVDSRNPSYYSYGVANDNVQSHSAGGSVFIRKLFGFGLESKLSYSIQRSKRKYSLETDDTIFKERYDDLVNPPYDNKGEVSLDLNMSLLKAFNNSPVRMELEAEQNDIERMEHLLEDSISKVIISTSKSYWDYFICHKNHEYHLELDRVLEKRHSDMDSLIKAGVRSRNDLLAVRVSLMQNRNRIKNAEVSLRNAKMQLLQAMGCPESQLPGYPAVEFSQGGLYMDDLPEAANVDDELIDRIFSTRNDLAALRKAVDSAELKLKIEKASQLPDLNVGLTLGTTGTSYADGAGHFLGSGMDNIRGLNVTGTVGSSIKLGNGTKRGAVDKVQADYDIACAELARARNSLKLELTNAVENISLYRTMVDDSRAVLELQKSFYENEQKRFTAGYITVDSLIQQDQNYLEAQISYYQNLAGYLNSVLEYKYHSAQMLTLQ